MPEPVNEVVDSEALQRLRDIIFCEPETSIEDLEARIHDLNEAVESLKSRPDAKEGCG